MESLGVGGDAEGELRDNPALYARIRLRAQGAANPPLRRRAFRFEPPCFCPLCGIHAANPGQEAETTDLETGPHGQVRTVLGVPFDRVPGVPCPQEFSARTR